MDKRRQISVNSVFNISCLVSIHGLRARVGERNTNPRFLGGSEAQQAEIMLKFTVRMQFGE